MKASSKCPRVESSTGAAPRPPSGDPTAEEVVDPIAAVDPLASSSSDSSLQSMLDTVMTVQAVHGQLPLDVLTEFRGLRVDLACAKGSTPQPPPFDDES